MTVNTFEVKGFEKFGEVGERLNKHVQRQVDLASKLGVNKGADLIAYGRVSAPKPTNIKPDSAIGIAARILRVPTEHIFYRTFVRGVKVSRAKGRTAKPWASVMMRGNAINVVDLLVSGEEAKAMYGFSTRRGRVGGKKKPEMRSKAASARVGGRRSGKVKIGKRVYSNAYIEDGSYRAKKGMYGKLTIEQYYVQKLGAKAGKKLAGDRFLLFQKKDKGQALPYPSKVIKIDKKRVMEALSRGAESASRKYHVQIADWQHKEVNRRLKKLGLL